MRVTVFLPLVMLGACAARGPLPVAEPAARVFYGDIALDSATGRAALRARVANAARGFCAKHEDEITPDALRTDKFYCLERVRDTLVAEMPGAVRGAYRTAMDEAGIIGRRL
ncbi:MAG: UrcA family protein [Sphingomonas sp.]|uniref:UrcA family protein n=1 Tax=Sphingomonas sp. TaxID=28214 RepID=UPI0025FBC299|nr:UrcA family protein [Sphingomonas sp.]MBX3563415.1 UrcA family protein [Sphingomonas sp.]